MTQHRMQSYIPTITSRLHILADIADQMEHDQPPPNDKSANTNIQQLFFKCLIESIQKQQQQQQQNRPVDFSTNTIKQEKIEQPSSPPHPKHNKSIRPFNAYRLSLPVDIYSSSNEELLNRIQQENSIPFKKRVRPCTPPADKDQHGTYSERRRKNNEAAKRSRDVRRVKEDEIALRAAWLEQENVKLRLENVHLKQENVQLRYQVYSSTES